MNFPKDAFKRKLWSFNGEVDLDPICESAVEDKQVKRKVETEVKQAQCDIKESFIRLEKKCDELKTRFDTGKDFITIPKDDQKAAV